MHRRGGKRIRMDWTPVEEENPYHGIDISDEINDPEETTSSRPGRMTRQRTRGAAATVCYLEDDEDDLYFSRKRKPSRKPVEREKHHVEKQQRNEERIDKPLAADKDRESNIDENSLYYVVRHSRSAATSIVDEWIESYKIDRESALIALMQFFINASGCKGRITVEMQHMEHAAIIRKMTEEFDEESGEYPLIMSGQQWKKFKSNFCDFVQTLVKQCQYSIIYDQYLMDHVISLLTGLSDSQVRAFRHTATLAAMKLMTALVDVALLVSINFDNAARQYDAEIIKTRDKRATDRLESLMAKRTELEENMDEIKNMLTYMFKSVFVHRYRDTLPEIRAICMTEIGIWMQKFSQNFLDDSYLKYIGWTLHDKVGDVRLRCLQALLPLYETEELKGKLELFTSKFKDRIVAMTLDKEFEVAVHAVRLVISILKIHHDILTDKDCEIVYELVYSSHRGVAQAAAEFLNVRLFCPDESAVAGIRTKRGKQRLVNTPLIRDLVQFFIESELHEHGAYLVDSFIDNNPMVKDWECITDLLMEEPGPNEEPLDNKQEATLIEIMVSSCKQAATGEPPIGRGNNRKMNLSAKEIKQVQDDKQKLTQHFIQILPLLLHKFSADAEKLTNLLTISQYFDLDLYTTLRQEANLQALLDQIAHIMSIHSDREVLESASKALEFLCTEGSAIYTKCDVSRSHIIDQCVNRYKEAIDDWRNLIMGEEIPDADETYNVEISLKRVAILYSCHNLNQWGLFESLFKDIEDCQGGIGDCSIPIMALVHCIESCFFSINWGLVYLENSCDPDSISSCVAELQNNLHQYIATCYALLKNAQNQQIQEAAYVSICDLLVTFCNQLTSNENTNLHKLAFEANEEQQNLLNLFVQHHVFSTLQEESHDETKIEELHKKRNILAAYCKLIVYNIISIKAAADIFKHYLRCYNEYGDIIKTTLGKAREINKVNTAMTMCLSLVNQFKEIEKSLRHLKQSQELQDLKELAKRFALSFGLDAIKNREACIGLHRAGILFAINQSAESEDSTSRLLFFEILHEFTNKLLKQDKKVVLNFLDRRINSINENSTPLNLYRNSLLHGDNDQPTHSSKKTVNRRKREQDQDEDETEDQSEADI